MSPLPRSRKPSSSASMHSAYTTGKSRLSVLYWGKNPVNVIALYPPRHETLQKLACGSFKRLEIQCLKKKSLEWNTTLAVRTLTHLRHFPHPFRLHRPCYRTFQPFRSPLNSQSIQFSLPPKPRRELARKASASDSRGAQSESLHRRPSTLRMFPWMFFILFREI